MPLLQSELPDPPNHRQRASLFPRSIESFSNTSNFQFAFNHNGLQNTTFGRHQP